MFFKKRPLRQAQWDPATQTPAIRCSICTGEQVAGFINRESGSFCAIQLLRDEDDLQAFRDAYGLGDMTIRKIY